MLTQDPADRPSLPASRKREGTVPTISPIKSQVVTVLETWMAAAIHFAKPRKPRHQPRPSGINHFQYRGIAARGWVSVSISGR